MQRIEAIDEYNRAQRLGMRDYREKTAAGKYPYLPALDELLEKTDTESQIPLGTIEIPLDYVVGTKTTGRTMAFASNFMPLLPEDTEFASKWLSLCMAHTILECKFYYRQSWIIEFVIFFIFFLSGFWAAFCCCAKALPYGPCTGKATC